MPGRGRQEERTNQTNRPVHRFANEEICQPHRERSCHRGAQARGERVEPKHHHERDVPVDVKAPTPVIQGLKEDGKEDVLPIVQGVSDEIRVKPVGRFVAEETVRNTG